MMTPSMNTNRYGGIMDKVAKAAGFRPRGKVAERIALAEELGINRSGLIQQILEANLGLLDSVIEKKRSQLRKVIEVPLS